METKKWNMGENMEQIKAMLETMATEDAFAPMLRKLAKSGDLAADVVALGARKGFHFTETDWQAYADWCDSIPTGQPARQPLSEEELESIAGGHGQLIEKMSPDCWFFASGDAEMRDGHSRKKCRQFCCCVIKILEGTAYFCRCHDTYKCIGTWHLAEGCVN